MSLLLKDCNIVDATSPEVRRDQYVLVEGDTIREVGSGRPPAADRRALPFRGAAAGGQALLCVRVGYGGGPNSPSRVEFATRLKNDLLPEPSFSALFRR